MNNKKLCSKGLNQSPINIKTSKIKTCSSNCNLLFYYKNSSYNIKIINKNLIISNDKGSYIHYNHDIYDLDKISFSIPSLHKIDNISYPLEVQLYHRSLVDNHVRNHYLYKEYDKRKDELNIFKNDLGDILNNEWYTKILPESWESEETIAGPCYRICTDKTKGKIDLDTV
jgi:carbonic anhydrase